MWRITATCMLIQRSRLFCQLVSHGFASCLALSLCLILLLAMSQDAPGPGRHVEDHGHVHAHSTITTILPVGEPWVCELSRSKSLSHFAFGHVRRRARAWPTCGGSRPRACSFNDHDYFASW